jgi:hypothetical protein
MIKKQAAGGFIKQATGPLSDTVEAVLFRTLGISLFCNHLDTFICV